MRWLLTAAFVMLLPVSAGASAVAPRMASCDAAVRDAPTLDRKLAPTAVFTTALEPVGVEDGEDVYLVIGTETAVLKDGTRLTVTLAGCENYSNSYSFRVADKTPLRQGGYWLRRAAKLMGEVEAVSRADTPVDFAELRRDLRSAAHRRHTHHFGKGELVLREGGVLEPNYSVEVAQDETGSTVTVNYWVHL